MSAKSDSSNPNNPENEYNSTDEKYHENDLKHNSDDKSNFNVENEDTRSKKSKNMLKINGVDFTWDDNPTIDHFPNLIDQFNVDSHSKKYKKYIRITMENDVDAPVEKIVHKLLDKSSKTTDSESSHCQSLLNHITIGKENFTVEFSKPAANDIFLGKSTKNLQYIGDQLVGRIHVHKQSKSESNSTNQNKSDDIPRSWHDSPSFGSWCERKVF